MANAKLMIKMRYSQPVAKLFDRKLCLSLLYVPQSAVQVNKIFCWGIYDTGFYGRIRFFFWYASPIYGYWQSGLFRITVAAWYMHVNTEGDENHDFGELFGIRYVLLSLNTVATAKSSL